jgi:hypothetical protein
MVQLMSKMMTDKNAGKFVVPIVPDESRTFGMDALFAGSAFIHIRVRIMSLLTGKACCTIKKPPTGLSSRRE